MDEVRYYTTEDIAEMKVDPGFVTQADYNALLAKARRLRKAFVQKINTTQDLTVEDGQLLADTVELGETP